MTLASKYHACTHMRTKERSHTHAHHTHTHADIHMCTHITHTHAGKAILGTQWVNGVYLIERANVCGYHFWKIWQIPFPINCIILISNICCFVHRCYMRYLVSQCVNLTYTMRMDGTVRQVLQSLSDHYMFLSFF